MALLVMIGLVGGDEYIYPILRFTWLCDEAHCYNVLTVISKLFVIVMGPFLVLVVAHFIRYLVRPGELLNVPLKMKGISGVEVEVVRDCFGDKYGHDVDGFCEYNRVCSANGR